MTATRSLHEREAGALHVSGNWLMFRLSAVVNVRRLSSTFSTFRLRSLPLTNQYDDSPIVAYSWNRLDMINDDGVLPPSEMC